MFNLSGSEIIVILLLALVVLGPEKLPDAIRRVGRTYAELKKMGNSFQSEMRSVLDEPMKEMRETADLLRQSADFTDGELTTTASPPRASQVGRTSTTTGTTVDGHGAQPSTTEAPPASMPNPTRASATDAPSTAEPATPGTPAAATLPASTPPADDEPDEALINRTLSGGQ